MSECKSIRGKLFGGHRYRIEWREGYVRSEWASFICDRVRQERQACGRCGEPDPQNPEWVTVSRRGLNGYSWPTEWAKTYDEHGELWTSGGWS